jgi:amidohydrolase
VAFTDGEFFASGVEFYIDLIGKSSHGAQPQRGTDCVKTGAHLINALLEIPARDIDPLEICVVSVGTFHAGDCVNILAGTASLSGIVRSYNTKTRDSILNRIQTICGGIETIYDCKVSPRIVITYPPLINDKKLAELLRPLLPGEIVLAQKVMLAEDFSYYAETLPCLYMLLGIRKEDAAIFPLHSDQFDFDESVLPIGLETYLSIIKAFA